MHLFRIVRDVRFQLGTLVLMAFVFGLGSATFGQDKQIKKEPVKSSPANSGEKMFKQYCAVCHGETGKGDGPAASVEAAAGGFDHAGAAS